MSRRIRTASYFVFNGIFTTILIVFLFFAVKFGGCFSAAARIPPMEPYQVMRILLYGSSSTEIGETVSAVISLLDTDGNECAVIERSWNGNALAVEFAAAEFSGRRFFFPAMIYGKSSVSERRELLNGKSGTTLYPYYMENKQCMLFGSNTTYAERHDLYRLAQFAFNPVSLLTGGFSKRYIVDLSRCTTGVYYTITILPGGTVRLNVE